MVVILRDRSMLGSGEGIAGLGRAEAVGLKIGRGK